MTPGKYKVLSELPGLEHGEPRDIAEALDDPYTVTTDEKADVPLLAVRVGDADE